MAGKTLTKTAESQLLRSHFRGAGTCHSALSCFALFQPAFSAFPQQTRTCLFWGSLSSQPFFPSSESPCFFTAVMWGTLFLSTAFLVSQKEKEQHNRRRFFGWFVFFSYEVNLC